MRAIIDLPNAQVQELDRLRRRNRVSRTELVRQAVTAFLEQQHREQACKAFGLWKKKPVDALDLQRRLRQEWEQ